MGFCLHCGTQTKPAAKFCPACGAKLTIAPDSPVAAPTAVPASPTSPQIKMRSPSNRNTFRVPDEAALQAAIESTGASPKPARNRISLVLGTKEINEPLTQSPSKTVESVVQQIEPTQPQQIPNYSPSTNTNTTTTITEAPPSNSEASGVVPENVEVPSVPEATAVVSETPAPVVIEEPSPAQEISIPVETTPIPETPVPDVAPEAPTLKVSPPKDEEMDEITSVLMEVSSAIGSTPDQPQLLLTLSKAHSVIDDILSSAGVSAISSEADISVINDILSDIATSGDSNNKSSPIPISINSTNISDLIDSILDLNSPNPLAPPPSPAVPFHDKKTADSKDWSYDEETY